MHHPNSRLGSTGPVQRNTKEPPESAGAATRGKRISADTLLKLGLALVLTVAGLYVIVKVRAISDKTHADIANRMEGPAKDIDDQWRTDPEKAYQDFCRRSLAERLEAEKEGAVKGENLHGFQSCQYAMAVRDYDAFNLYVQRCYPDTAVRLRINAELQQGDESAARGEPDKAKFHWAMALCEIEPLLNALPDVTHEDRAARQWVLHLSAYCENKLGKRNVARVHFEQAESVTPDAPDRRLAMHRKNLEDVVGNRSTNQELRVGAYRNFLNAQNYVNQRDVLRVEFFGRQQAIRP
jgi:hypothetical protein